VSSALILAASVQRDWRIAISYRLAYVIEIASIGLTLVLFYYLGQIVDSSTLPVAAEFDGGYFAFVAVGLALARVLHSGLTPFAQQLREDQMTGTLENLMATPASPSVLVLASGAYDLLRGTAFGVLIILTAAVFFGLDIETDPDSALTVAGGLVACLLMFAALGVALAAFTVVFKQTTALLAVVTSGIAVFGGVYFPVELLPDGLRLLSELLPFTWGLEVLRDALLSGESDIARLGLLVAFDLVALPCALVLFNVALRRARRSGSLAQY
jgi:ABC-type multidrug transport system permease subunit